jgi:hypothetical protein
MTLGECFKILKTEATETSSRLFRTPGLVTATWNEEKWPMEMMCIWDQQVIPHPTNYLPDRRPSQFLNIIHIITVAPRNIPHIVPTLRPLYFLFTHLHSKCQIHLLDLARHLVPRFRRVLSLLNDALSLRDFLDPSDDLYLFHPPAAYANATAY